MDYPELVASVPGVPGDDLKVLTGVVRDYCRWHIAPVVAETITLDGTGSSTVLLPTLRLLAVTAVTLDGEALDLADVRVSAEKGAIRLGRRVCDRYGELQVTFTHGHQDCPDSLRAVLKSMHATGQFAGLTSAATLSNSFSRLVNAETGWDPYAESILANYRRPGRL